MNDSQAFHHGKGILPKEPRDLTGKDDPREKNFQKLTVGGIGEDPGLLVAGDQGEKGFPRLGPKPGGEANHGIVKKETMQKIKRVLWGDLPYPVKSVGRASY